VEAGVPSARFVRAGVEAGVPSARFVRAGVEAPASSGQRGSDAQKAAHAETPKIPDGFTPIFNGRDLSGWHISKTNHHGTTPDFRVVHGAIVGTQNPREQGGILLTDKKYRNVEVYMEVKPDWGCDSGLFLRSSEAGEAYQVMLDDLPGGSRSKQGEYVIRTACPRSLSRSLVPRRTGTFGTFSIRCGLGRSLSAISRPVSTRRCHACSRSSR